MSSDIGEVSNEPADLDPLSVAENSGVFCVVEADFPYIAYLRLHPVEYFSDVLPPMTDEEAVRNTCFMFLCDSMMHFSVKSMPIFSTRLAALTSLHTEASFSSSSRRMPPPRALLVMHTKGRQEVEPLIEQLMGSPDAADVCKFIEQLAVVAKDCGLRTVSRTTDFDDGELLYDCFREIATEMYRANAKEPSIALSTRDRPKSEGKTCCNVL